LKYGVRPKLTIGGQPNASFAHVPVHVEYVITELLKNSFRAVIENGTESEPIEVTIASAPDVPGNHAQDAFDQSTHSREPQNDTDVGFHIDTVVGTADANESVRHSNPSSQS